MSFVVIYLWKGERHRTRNYPTRRGAASIAGKLRADGWQAWVEEVS